MLFILCASCQAIFVKKQYYSFALFLGPKRGSDQSEINGGFGRVFESLRTGSCFFLLANLTGHETGNGIRCLLRITDSDLLSAKPYTFKGLTITIVSVPTARSELKALILCI
jgi:hypothetical protein